MTRLRPGMSRAVPVVALAALLVPLALAGQAWSRDGCLEFVPPLLFDASQVPPGPDPTPVTMGVDLFWWNGHRYLIHNLGNELEIMGLDDPLAPGPPLDSSFDVPPFGDRDYNLFNFSVCDDCRYGMAGFDVMGSVLFDFGTGSTPSFQSHQYYPAAAELGGFTFAQNGQQYLIAHDVVSGCQGAALVTINGLQPSDMQLLQCVADGAGAPVTVDGGFYLTGTGGAAYVYLVGRDSLVHMYRISGTGSNLRLQALGEIFHATWVVARGLDLDLDAPAPWSRLAVATSPYGVELWDLVDPGAPELLAQWNPNPQIAMQTAAIEYPYIWVGAMNMTATGSTFTYDMASPSFPEPLDPGFWDGSNPWNSYPGSGNAGAIFTDDGEWLFLSRGTVLERIHFCLSLFADGFESGDTSAWAATVP